MADYLFVNGTDAQIANINAGGSDVEARDTLAATATTAEFNTYLTSAGARAIMHTSSTAAHKKAVALALLVDAGVQLGPEIVSSLTAADAEKRNKVKIKRSAEDGKNLLDALLA